MQIEGAQCNQRNSGNSAQICGTQRNLTSLKSDQGFLLSKGFLSVLRNVLVCKSVTHAKQGGREKQPCTTSLTSKFHVSVANRFAVLFDGHLETSAQEDSSDVNLLYARMVDAFHHAADASLPNRVAAPKRPWISACTLDLLDRRLYARRWGHIAEECSLNKQIRVSVERDRSSWREGLLISGDWQQVRRLRKGFKPSQGRLKDSSGAFVSSELRAETLADHLERIQWAVRPTSAVPARGALNDTLTINSGPITREEVLKAARSLKQGRASGLDDVPGEYWKAVLQEGSESSRWVVDFLQSVLGTEVGAKAWHEAQFALLFKKRRPRSV